jgi:hypothetical protein
VRSAPVLVCAAFSIGYAARLAAHSRGLPRRFAARSDVTISYMSSLATVRRHLSVVAVAPVVILGVLAMHGLSATEEPALHHPARATVTPHHGHHDERDSSDTKSDSPFHLGIISTWILATGVALFLRPWRGRFARRGDDRAPTRDLGRLLAPPEPTGPSPGFVLGGDAALLIRSNLMVNHWFERS